MLSDVTLPFGGPRTTRTGDGETVVVGGDGPGVGLAGAMIRSRRLADRQLFRSRRSRTRRVSSAHAISA